MTSATLRLPKVNIGKLFTALLSLALAPLSFDRFRPMQNSFQHDKQEYHIVRFCTAKEKARKKKQGNFLVFACYDSIKTDFYFQSL